MRLVHFAAAEPRAQLACDEALLREAEAGRIGETVRLWQLAAPAVVLGVGARWRQEVIEENCRTDGVPLLRRISGGGAVVLAPGCVNYSLLLDTAARPELRAVRPSYARILAPLAERLSARGPRVRHAALSDLAWRGRKVGGSAQKRARRWLLHHGTILFALDVALLSRYLAHPPSEPAYRAGRPHGEFVANLPLKQRDATACVLEAFGLPPDAAAEELGAEVAARVAELVKVKYARADWNLRR